MGLGQVFCFFRVKSHKNHRKLKKNAWPLVGLYADPGLDLTYFLNESMQKSYLLVKMLEIIEINHLKHNY